jgi:hypothetical protein
LRSAECSLRGQETDDDIAREVEEFEKASKRYEALAAEERHRKHFRHNDTRPIGASNGVDAKNLESMPLIFGSRQMVNEPLKCDQGTGCNLCIHSEEKYISLPPGRYKFIEEEDEVLRKDDEDDDECNGKRRSRTAQIASQKKTSNRMLTELLNTLSFIEAYNKGVNREIDEVGTDSDRTQKHQKDEEDTEFVISGGEVYEEEAEVSIRRPTKKRLPTKKTRGRLKATVEQSENSMEPKWKALSHFGHLRRYDDLQMNHASFYPLKVKGKTIASAKKAIREILDDDDTLDSFFRDEEIALEEKAYTRMLRSYRGKSDQERIERKTHEEERKLEVREFEYYQRRSKRKATPQEFEWKMVVKRHINFVRSDEGLPEDLEACPFGIDCPICAPFLQSESGSCEEEHIINPPFRRVDDSSFLAMEGMPTEMPRSRRERKWAQLQTQKTLSALKLAELCTALDFIEDFNKGMIK